jgi:hypothetical protein
MTGKLFLFEITKKWRSSKFLLLGYLGIQVLLLFVTRVFLWNGTVAGELTTQGIRTNSDISLPFALTMMLFFMLALAIGAFPFIEGIYRFERDLSGKQAYLELMIPAVSWKKVLAKLLATLCSLIVCGTASLFSMFLFIAVNSNFNTILGEFIRQCLSGLSNHWLQALFILVYLIFNFASIFITIFFCIATAKSFTHKNKVAVPIGILTFILIAGLLAVLGSQLEKVPLVNFSIGRIETSLSQTIADIIVFVAAMAGTGWMMEKKIEH